MHLSARTWCLKKHFQLEDPLCILPGDPLFPMLWKCFQHDVCRSCRSFTLIVCFFSSLFAKPKKKNLLMCKWPARPTHVEPGRGWSVRRRSSWVLFISRISPWPWAQEVSSCLQQSGHHASCLPFNFKCRKDYRARLISAGNLWCTFWGVFTPM